MTKATPKEFLSTKKILLISLVPVVVIGGLVLLLYALPVNGASLAALRTLHLPVGKVDKFMVSIQNIEQALTPGIAVTADNLEAQFKQYAHVAASNKLIRTYAIPVPNSKIDEQEKRSLVNAWWNGQEKLNTSGWKKVRTVEALLARGTDFALTAQTHSEDPATKIFGGDAGFVDESSMLPEYKGALVQLKRGDSSVIASRHGLHIVRLLNSAKDATGKTRYHIQEIFISSQGFEEWYNHQIRDVHTSLYVK